MKRFLILFILMASGSAFAQAPTIFWASDPVKPNEVIMTQGDGLDGETVLKIVDLGNGRIKGQPKVASVDDLWGLKALSIESLQPSAQTGKYLIPSNWDMSLYVIYPEREGLKGKPSLVNAPTSWWIQGSDVKFSTPDSEFSIYGKCLSYNDAAQVYLKSSAGKFIKLQVKEQDMWHLTLDLDNLSEDTYGVYVHNGLGGKYGWIEAGELAVKSKEQWPTKVFNVVDYGAKPNSNPQRSILDQTNDAPAFQKALDAAGANGGGVVYIPSGCYRLVEDLHVPRFVTLRGESELSTNLGWVDREDALVGLINGTNNFAVEDLTIFVQNYYSVIRGDHGHTPGAGNISVKGVTIRANRLLGVESRTYPKDWKTRHIARQWNLLRREAPLNFGGENISVIDCDVLASHNSIILDKASGILANNNFHCPYVFQNSQYWIRGCENLVIVNNDIYGGGCMGTHNTTRGVNNQSDWECHINTVSRNIYFANNYQHDNWKWDREMMTLDSHGYNGPYLGPVAEGKGDQVVIPDAFPVLSVGGLITSVSGGPILSQKKLESDKYYRIIVKMESKKDSLDWERCFANFYDESESIEQSEPDMMQRNGNSRNLKHGKVKGARIRGSKGLDVKSFRIAKSWDEIRDSSKGEQLFSSVKLSGTQSKETDLLFDFDNDGTLYAELVIKANGVGILGQVELLHENRSVALSMGISRLGGNKVNFERKSKSSYSGDINNYLGAMVYVLEGKGCGQFRKIVGGSGSTLKLDKAWDVELDDTSVISIHRSHDHQIFVNNRFEDGGDAMLLYAGSVENIVANNTAVRSSGFVVTGLMACVPMYCQFLNNEIISGAGHGSPPFNLRGGRLSVEPYAPMGYLNGYQTIGVVFRNNKLDNMASATICGPVQNVLLERNKFRNTETGVIVNAVGMGSFDRGWSWPQDILLRDNIYEGVDVKLKADKETSTVKVLE